MIRIRVDGVFTLAPDAREVYLRGLDCLNATLRCFGVLVNAHRAAHFLAQVLHESGGLRHLEENLYYTSPDRLMKIWPNRFPTLSSAVRVIRNPEALANHVYGGRADLGNIEIGDGWKFRGRGPIQITGRLNYRTIGTMLDIDLTAQPDLVVSDAYLWPVAAAIWKQRGCNRHADQDDVRAVTKCVNGGTIGIAERAKWLEKTRGVVEAD
jgi:putative chitinase